MKTGWLHSRAFLVCAALAIGPAMERRAAAEVIAASAATVVTPVAGGFEYSYTITNTSEAGGPGLIAWAMPFFDDAAGSFVGEISAPAGWGVLFTALTPSTTDDEIWDYLAADDPKNDSYGAPGSAFDNPPYALLFFADPFASTPGIAPGASLGGFSYVSPFEGVNIPFIAGYDNLALTIGDPIAPRTENFPAAVPAPASVVLLFAGAATLLAAAGVRGVR